MTNKHGGRWREERRLEEGRALWDVLKPKLGREHQSRHFVPGESEMHRGYQKSDSWTWRTRGKSSKERGGVHECDWRVYLRMKLTNIVIPGVVTSSTIPSRSSISLPYLRVGLSNILAGLIIWEIEVSTGIHHGWLSDCRLIWLLMSLVNGRIRCTCIWGYSRCHRASRPVLLCLPVANRKSLSRLCTRDMKVDNFCLSVIKFYV